jgi:hypothetical protein
LGLDFVTKCTPTFQRSWNRDCAVLLEPDLFQRHPQLAGRTYRLTPAEGVRVKEGEEILLRWCAEDLLAFRGRTLLGTVAKPPGALIDALKHSGGALCARVDRVHPRSGASDISIIP